MESILILILQLFTAGEDISQAVLGKSLKAALQEDVICRQHFDDRQDDFQKALQIDNPAIRMHALEFLRAQILAKCGVRP
jgi:hypothetical protein